MTEDDALRDWIMAESPEIRHDVALMADLIRELVKLEREKRGLDNPRGTGTLGLNKAKLSSRQPDYLGSAFIRGHNYSIQGWTTADKQNIRLSFYPHGRSNPDSRT